MLKMGINDIFWLSYKDLNEKKVRTALTVVMVVIGVASIIALLSQTAGISQSIQGALQSLGPTSIILTSTRATGFTVADTARLAQLPHVNVTIPIVTGQANLLINNQNTSVTLIGVTPQGLDAMLGGIKIYQGSVYQDSIAPSSLVGYSVAFPSTTGGKQNVFVGRPATLQLTGRGASSYTIPVAGILQSYGTSLISVDTGVVMSLSAAETLLHRSSFNTVLIKATNTSGVNQLSTLVTDIYGSNARVINTQQLAQTASSIIGSISALFTVIAGISLLVAAIGIMNIMLIAVYERTHEIGILKSIGFKDRDILLVFLFQALMIGIIGGLIGILLGAGVSYALSYAITSAQSSSQASTTTISQFRGGGGGFGGGNPGASGIGSGSGTLSYHPVFTPSTIIVAFLVAVFVSILAGMYPAWRASKLQPIDALRQL